MLGSNYLFVFLKKKLSNIEKHVSSVRIYRKEAPQYFSIKNYFQTKKIMNFKGQIYWKDKKGYEEARFGRVFNRRTTERYPIAVFFPKNEKDVVVAVQFANEKNYKIAIRAGGHSWAAWSVRDEGILLDLKYFNKIKLNKKTGIVQVQPATKGGAELNPFLKEHGLMFCGGHCPTVGVGGFLLQGGQGWNARGWGWAAEYIVALDIVTAEGELVRADATQNQDLYWAARGAGPGFFGVVTCFHLKTVPLPKVLYASTYVFPSEYASTILTWWQQIHGTVSLNIELVLLGQNISISDVGFGISEGESSRHPTSDIRNVIIVHALVLEQTIEAAMTALKPFEACPFIEKAYIRREYYETTFAEQLKLQTEANPEGHRWAVNNAWLEGDMSQITSLMLPAFTDLPTPKTFSLWYSMAPLRALPDMAFSLQTGIYFASYVIWENEEDDAKNRAWLKGIMERIEPITAGQYLGDSDFTVHQRKFMGDENFEKLQKIRAKRDPKGLFHSYLTQSDKTLNQNIWVE
jgi:FAD/FMN-containing dehydrogenase